MAIARRALLLLCLALLIGSRGAAWAEADEYQLKAAYIHRFLPFVTWPSAALGVPGQPIRVGIIGDDPFGDALERGLLDKRLDGRPIAIARFRSVDDYRPCAVVFVSRSERSRYGKILARLASAPVLVVGEGEEFCFSGGGISFLLVDNKIQFTINQGAIEQAGLQVSSKLLALASPCPRGGGR